MGVETVARNTERPAGLDGRTACEAFQATAAAHPDRPAIRTRGDEFTCSWGEHAARVPTIAAGQAAGRRADADLHLRHHWSAEGSADHPRQHLRDRPLLRRADPVP